MGGACLKLSVEIRVEFLIERFDTCFLDATFSHEFVPVALSERLECSDGLVHLGLGEGGFVDFIVSILAETDHVDENVLAKAAPVAAEELAHLHHLLGLVRVHMHHRYIEGLDDIR